MAGTYKKIPQATKREEITTTENIDWIVQAIDQYQKETENLREQLTPTSPLAMKEQRKKEATSKL